MESRLLAHAERERYRGGLALMILTCCALLPSISVAQNAIQLRDVTGASGVDFVHTDGGSGQRYIVETVSAGLALFDYDRDGDIDIYFLNGAPLRGTTVDVRPTHALYRNDGGFHFTNVTRESGLSDTGYGLGVAVADYDNDGLPDVYLNNYGPKVMYHNNGDGTFSDVSARTATTGNAEHAGAGACFLDGDGDGDLDLYVASYLRFTYDTHVRNMYLGHHVYPGPDHYAPVPSRYYRNNGDGSFADASLESGIAAHRGRGMGVVAADYDQDGDTDIFVANDSMASFLFENDGQGRFTEVAIRAGLAFDLFGSVHGNMGIDCGDYDNDGLLDFYETSYQNQLATLYRNLGGGLYDDVTLTTGAGQGTAPHVTWGNGLIDFDNDGDRDLYVACGHLYDNLELFCRTTAYRMPNILLSNDGQGKFTDVTATSGDGLKPALSSRGTAFDDLDNDGDEDVVVLNSREKATVLRNDSLNKHHWLQIQLCGSRANRDAVGAHVTVAAGTLVQVAEVHSGRSYQSHYGTRLHFGLGARERVERIEIRWPGRRVQTLSPVPVDRMLTVVEETGG